MANEKANKIIYGVNTLIDLTSDTVSASTLAQGTTAHDASGNQIVGTLTPGDPTPKVPYTVTLDATETQVIEEVDSYEEQSPDLPYGFTYGSAVVYSGEIHILGGRDNETSHYKWNGTSWVSVSTLPYSFMNGSAVVYNDEIHILGGAYSGTIYRYHYKWDGASWTDVGNLPYEYRNGAAVVYNNEIHILGGLNNTTSHYKWNGTSWVNASTIPFDFSYSSAVVYDNEIHLLGGLNYPQNHLTWDGTSWTQVDSLPYQFYSGCSVVFDNEIHIIGSSIGTANKNHYKWDGIEWVAVSNTPRNCVRSDAVVYNDKIFILGGYAASFNYTTWYSYMAGDPKPITVPSLASLTPATATAGDIVSGKTAWVNGEEVTGTASDSISGFEFIGNGTSPIGSTAVNITLSKSMANYKWLIFAMNQNQYNGTSSNYARCRAGSTLIRTSSFTSSTTFTVYKNASVGTGTLNIKVTKVSDTQITVSTTAESGWNGFSVIGVKF